MKLIAPKGVETTTFKGKVYEVDKDGTVDVPADAVMTLASHGFKRPQPPAPNAIKPQTPAEKKKAEADAKVKADAEAAAAAAEALAKQHAEEDAAAEAGDPEAIAKVKARLEALAATAKGAEKTGILGKLEKLVGK